MPGPVSVTETYCPPFAVQPTLMVMSPPCGVNLIALDRPEDEDDEEEGVRYAHHIDLPDKMAIFEASFEGMSEFFRLGGEQAAGVGDVATIEGSAQVTE